MLARLAARPELKEVMFLSTCNRVEVMATPRKPDGAKRRAARHPRRALRARRRSGRDELAPFLYERDGDEAVRHVFRVAASLDSMVLGEPQILGQVKEAYDAAIAAGTLGASSGAA